MGQLVQASKSEEAHLLKGRGLTTTLFGVLESLPPPPIYKTNALYSRKTSSLYPRALRPSPVPPPSTLAPPTHAPLPTPLPPPHRLDNQLHAQLTRPNLIVRAPHRFSPHDVPVHARSHEPPDDAPASCGGFLHWDERGRGGRRGGGEEGVEEVGGVGVRDHVVVLGVED